MIDEDDPTIPTIPACPCCGGSGMHEHKPYINASPYDTDAECTTCNGSGKSWFDMRRNTCTGYRLLMKSFR